MCNVKLVRVLQQIVAVVLQILKLSQIVFVHKILILMELNASNKFFPINQYKL